MGSFLSLDLIVFFFMFELTLVPAYFIIAGWGHQRRAYAAIKFFLYTFLGSAFLLVGILALAFIHESPVPLPDLRARAADADPPVLVDGDPALPGLHGGLRGEGTALPAAHLVARRLHRGPGGGSVLLSGVLAKLGTYGIIRFDLNLFPHATRTLGPLFLTLAVIGIVYGAIVACAQRDMKRLVAYSSLAGIGFIALGTFATEHAGPRRWPCCSCSTTGIIVARAVHPHRLPLPAPGHLADDRDARAAEGGARSWPPSSPSSCWRPSACRASTGSSASSWCSSGTFITHRWWAVVADAAA